MIVDVLDDLVMSIVLRGLVVHTLYVDVLCTATMYLGVLSAGLLHALVCCTTYSMDSGTLIVILLTSSCYAWYKDNHQDEYSGVSTLTPSISLLAAVILVVVSEAMLFISILWSVVLSLVAHSIYTDTRPIACLPGVSILVVVYPPWLTALWEPPQ